MRRRELAHFSLAGHANADMESVSLRPDAERPSPDSQSVPRGQTPRDVLAPGQAARVEVVRLVRERRYEEALALLYRARAEAPNDAELGASIAQIKEFLAGAYARKLGGLDRIAPPVPIAAGRSPDPLLVARFVDGRSTFDDICQMSPLGRLRTLQVLISLYEGSPAGEPVPISTPPPPAVEPAPPTKRTSAPPPEAPSQSPIAAREVAVVAEPPAESERDRRFREAFARGTAAFVQRRVEEAVEAFRVCDELRPADGPAQVMLRRALLDFERRG